MILSPHRMIQSSVWRRRAELFVDIVFTLYTVQYSFFHATTLLQWHVIRLLSRNIFPRGSSLSFSTFSFYWSDVLLLYAWWEWNLRCLLFAGWCQMVSRRSQAARSSNKLHAQFYSHSRKYSDILATHFTGSATNKLVKKRRRYVSQVSFGLNKFGLIIYLFIIFCDTGSNTTLSCTVYNTKD